MAKRVENILCAIKITTSVMKKNVFLGFPKKYILIFGEKKISISYWIILFSKLVPYESGREYF